MHFAHPTSSSHPRALDLVCCFGQASVAASGVIMQAAGAALHSAQPEWRMPRLLF